MKSGTNVSAYSPSYGTPLCVAAYNGRVDVVELLLSRHVEVNGCHAGYHESALHAAAERGHEAIVRLLIEHGADINAEVWGVSTIYVAS